MAVGATLSEPLALAEVNDPGVMVMLVAPVATQLRMLLAPEAMLDGDAAKVVIVGAEPLPLPEPEPEPDPDPDPEPALDLEVVPAAQPRRLMHVSNATAKEGVEMLMHEHVRLGLRRLKRLFVIVICIG